MIGDTALILASKNGYKGVVRLLVKAGANVDLRNVCGNISLIAEILQAIKE